jgi:putative ABC transport system permease protein
MMKSMYLAPLLLAPLWQKKGRALVSVMAIALGVALGYAVQLINRTAANEFSQALYTLSGEADLTVRGARAGFDEAVYPRIARLPEVAVASPGLEIDARVAGRDDSLRLLGLDAFRAGRLQPGLVGESGDRLDMLRSDAIFLSRSAAQALGLEAGAVLTVQVGLDDVDLRVAGLLSDDSTHQPLAVMDIGAAQWRFHRLGQLTRVDLRLRPGVEVSSFQRQLQRTLPPGIYVQPPESTVKSNLRLSDAYRTNLNVLALVALFAGALLVFSTQVLAVLRRRSELALLRVLGVTRSRLLLMLAGESALVGTAGALLGLVAGHLLAVATMATIGADLGAGFFAAVKPQVRLDVTALVTFLGAGILAALAGGLLPALEAARTQLAPALKTGDEQLPYARIRSPRVGLLLMAGGGVLAQLPAVGGLPLFGYGAVALLLVGAIALVPWVSARVFAALPLPRSVPGALALAQLRAASAQAGIGLAAVVAAVGLMVAMAIMVASFRDSLDAWLHRMLPADLYLRAGVPGDSAFLDESTQQAIARLPGVGRVEFLRAQQVLLDPSLPRVTLLARDLDAARAETVLPLVTPPIHPGPGDPPAVWVTEAAADFYRLRPGARLELPLAGRDAAFTVAGIWRDYARQNGALLIDRAVYIELTGDRLVTDAGFWLLPGTTREQVETSLRDALPRADRIEMSQPGEIRQLSLSIFDRTFAVTYVLEACVILIGLFGLSAGVAGQVAARRREFGMLRHVGMTRRQVGAMLASEGLFSAGLGLGVGLIPGWLIGLILVHVINRQSFHWSMELHTPWQMLGVLALALVLLAALTAALSGRHAMETDVVRAVREDW